MINNNNTMYYQNFILSFYSISNPNKEQHYYC